MSKRDKISIGDVVTADGCRPFRRQNADGSVEEGLIGTEKHLAHADRVVQMKPLEGGCRHEYEITGELVFNARGSTGAASDAYRSGWDQTFRSKGSHAAN